MRAANERSENFREFRLPLLSGGFADVIHGFSLLTQLGNVVPVFDQSLALGRFEVHPLDDIVGLTSETAELDLPPGMLVAFGDDRSERADCLLHRAQHPSEDRTKDESAGGFHNCDWEISHSGLLCSSYWEERLSPPEKRPLGASVSGQKETPFSNPKREREGGKVKPGYQGGGES